MKKSSEELSGKFVLRVPTETHRSLRKRAELVNMSLNELCNQFINKGLTDLSQLSDNHSEVISRLKAKFKDDFLGLVLFGSFARGDFTKSSDVDLLVVLSNNVSINRSLYKFIEADDFYSKTEIGHPLSLNFIHFPVNVENAGTIWLECSISGVILLDKTGELRETLTSIRKYIATGALQRKETHGQGYWIRT